MAILVKVIAALSTGRSPVTETKINRRDYFALDGIHKISVTTLGQIFYNVGAIFLKRKYLCMLVFIAANFLMSCQDDDHKQDPWQGEVDQLRSALTSFDDIESAKDKGYESEVTGYVKNMGFHYLNTAILDDKFDVENPELVLYVPDGHGGLKFVAVEYAVPIVDLNNPPPAPQGFKGDADVWEINTEFKLWTLHAWVGTDNPHGIFHPHNPNIP
jgi:hypothetical protein